LLAAGCQSSSQQVTGPSSNTKCTVAATVSTSEFGPEGGAARITVQTSRDCTWEIGANAEWVTVGSPASGQGNGSAEFAVRGNADPVARSALLTAGGQEIKINQRAGACRYDVSPAEASVPPEGGRRDIDVPASSPLCEWTARSEASWITIQGGGPQRGSGRTGFQAAPSSGPLRRGEIVIGDRRLAIVQASACGYRLVPPGASFAADGARADIQVRTFAECSWTAASEVSWITIADGAAGTGPGSVHISISANTGPPRSGSVTIANQRFIASQASGCRFTISPPSWFLPVEGGRGAIRVDTTPGCGWTAVSSVDWMTITMGQAGTGIGEVWFAVAPNASGQRSGILTIGGIAFRATQAGVF
jgi:hypothetical protein